MTAFVVAALVLGLVTVGWLTRTLWWRTGAAGGSPGLAAGMAVFVVAVAALGYARIGNVPGIQVAPGQARAAAPAGSMPTMEQIAEIVDRALKQDPRNPRALALAGALAFDQGDYRTAVQRWETLAQIESADTPAGQQLREQLAEARRRAGLAPAAGAASPAASAARRAFKAQISGTVRLAPALQGRVAPDDTLFVFARATDGPRVPLAVLRKRANELPLQFTLDDSLAMSPDATISSASQVVITARISKGSAAAKPGDLQGVSAPVAVGASGVVIEISEVVK